MLYSSKILWLFRGAIMGFTNFLKYLPGGVLFHESREKLKPYEIEEREKAYQEYRASIGVLNGLKSGSVFDTYAKGHVATFDDVSGIFKEVTQKPKGKDKKPEVEKVALIKLPDGSSMKDKLKTADQALATEVKKLYSDALVMNPATITAQTEFAEKIAALNKVIAQDPPQFDSSAIASLLQEYRAEALKAIQAQQKSEKDRLTTLLNDPTSLAKITEAMGLTNAEDIQKFKDDTLQGLDESHRKESAKFSKGLENEINNLHANAQKERDRLAFLNERYNNSKFMHDMIDKMAEKLRLEGKLNEEDTTATIGIQGKYALFKGIDVKQMELIETISGRKSKHSVDENGIDHFEMELPCLANLSYHFGSHQQLEYDIMSQAMALRAMGKTRLNNWVNHPDEETAIEMAQTQFSGGVKAGFDPNNITIKVNGKEKTAKELFENNPKKLEQLKALYEKEHKDSTADNKRTSFKDMADLRSAVNSYRETAKAAEEKRKEKEAEQPAIEEGRQRQLR